MQEAPPAESGEDPRYKKLQHENRSLRDRLRRTEMVAEFGAEIVELIPPALPMKEWKGYAEKLQTFKGTAASETTQDEAPEPPPVERQEQEQRLAAVGASRTPGNASTEVKTAREIQELMSVDPAEGFKAAQAKYGTP